MLDRRSSRLIKWYALASIVLVLALLTTAGVFDGFLDAMGTAITDLLHDLNHQ